MNEENKNTDRHESVGVHCQVKTNFAEVMRMIDIMVESKEYLAIEKIKAKINFIEISEEEYNDLEKKR